jgi:zinc protease
VRNIAKNAARRELRRGGVESLETVADPVSSEDDPAAQAVTREEETLLWRTLARMPENYREPLVLFYREEQSISQVAVELDLTEETVKQRLSRGRAMLREEMVALVESTLERTRPGSAFTVGVLVALPIAAASTASAAVAANAVTKTSVGTAGKGFLAQLGLGVVIGPVIGLIFSYFGAKAAASRARSELERKIIVRYSQWMVAFCFLMSIGLAAVLSQAGKLYAASAVGIVLGVCTWTAALVAGIILMSQCMDRKVKRVETAARDEDPEMKRANGKSGITG